MKSPFFVKCTLALFLVLGALGVTACGPNPLAPSVVAEEPTSFVVPITSAVAPFEARVIDGVSWTVPTGIDLTTFPLLGGALTDREAKFLGLHKEPLKHDTIFYNELRERHTFEAKMQKAGVGVWVDRDGVVRYLASCINRQEVMKMTEKCPLSVSCPSGVFTNADGTKTQGSPTQMVGTLDGVVPSVSSALSANTATSQSLADTKKAKDSKGFFDGLFGEILKTLLQLVLLFLLLWAIFAIGRGFVRWLNEPAPAPVAPVPPAPVAPVAPAPVAPVPAPPAPPVAPVVVTPAPVPVVTLLPRPIPHPTFGQGQYGPNGEVWYGPYDNLRVRDQGAQGFQVFANDDTLGDTFRQDVRIVNAGTQGSWLVVSQPGN